MKSTKKVVLNLKYKKSEVLNEGKVFKGGAQHPKYIKELVINVSDDYDFNLDTEEFTKNGMYAVEISGSDRALKEFGKFLINVAMFDTEDEDYHEHFDNISDYEGKPLVNLIVRKQ